MRCHLAMNAMLNSAHVRTFDLQKKLSEAEAVLPTRWPSILRRRRHREPALGGGLTSMIAILMIVGSRVSSERAQSHSWREFEPGLETRMGRSQ